MPLLALSHDPDVLPAEAYDVRGWEVRTEPDDARVGQVDDLLVEPAGTPRYLVLKLRRGDKGRLLVPLSRAWADVERKVVWVSAFTEKALRSMPRYGGDPKAVSPDAEERLLEEYRRGGPTRSPQPPPDTELVRLSALDEHRVAKGSADPRGWTVVGGDGQKMGTVRDLLVDPAAMKVRYLDLDVNEPRLELERIDRHVLIPVERVRLDGDERRVVVDVLFGRDMADYPVYTGLPLDEGAERAIQDWFAGSAGKTLSGPGWADRSARRFFGTPRRLRREEGAAADAPAPHESGGDAIREGGSARVRLPERGEVHIHVTDEEIVIERRGDDG